MSLRLPPRRWQTEALREWQKSYHGIVEVVTGAGKTMFAFLCIEDFRRVYRNGRIVVLVPTLALADQWYIGLLEDLGASADDVAVYSGRERPSSPNPINIAVLNSARSLSGTLYQEPTFLIVDECHRAATPVNSRGLGGDHAAALGLSATPVRKYDDGLQRFLAPVIGPVVYEYGYERALQDGIVTPVSLVNVRIELSQEEERQIGALSRRIAAAFGRYKKDGNNEPLKRLLQRRAAVSASARMRVPVAAALVERHRGGRALVFHERVRGAEQIANLLRGRGHSVALYHSQMAANVRRDNLRLFRRGVFDVLVSCRALDEGMNVPEAAIAVIASSTASERQRIQRLGRVLRPARGKSRATVYTLYATPQEEGRLTKEAQKLAESANVSWKESHLREDGATSN